MSITYLEAIREAQAKLLRDDERVFIYGQDVGGGFGGAFKATKGLAKEFPGRVLNTPISEDAIVGAAIAAAIQGMRPIVEMQFADFTSIALNQILNHAGTHYWRTGVPVPMTVRLPSGGTKVRGYALLANGRTCANDGASAIRWNKGQRAVSQSIDGIDLRALSRTDRDDARDGGRRLHHAY